MALIRHLHPLWRRLPHALRRKVYESLTGLFASEAVWTAATPTGPAAPLTVVGPLSAPSGLGELARLFLRGAIATGEKVGLVDLSAPLMQRSVVPLPRLPPPSAGPGTILLAVQPPNVGHALTLLGRPFLKNKLLIGCWAWELERVPPGWVQQSRLVHVIGAPSLFCRDAFRQAFRREVLLLPLPVAGAPVRPRAQRSGPVAFGAAMDLGSTSARKNPLGVLSAFKAAFEGQPDVRLKLKIRDAQADGAAMAAIRSLVARHGSSIELELADLSAGELEQWWDGVDVLISLHRAEGLGLWPAEAMLRGIPVISTHWSATTEFINEANGWPVPVKLVDVADPSGRYELAGAVWAEPDLQAAARAMREACHRPLVAAKGAAARKTVLEQFSSQRFARHLFARAQHPAGDEANC